MRRVEKKSPKLQGSGAQKTKKKKQRQKTHDYVTSPTLNTHGLGYGFAGGFLISYPNPYPHTHVVVSKTMTNTRFLGRGFISLFIDYILLCNCIFITQKSALKYVDRGYDLTIYEVQIRVESLWIKKVREARKI